MKSTDDDKRKKPYRNTLYFGATEKLKHYKYPFKIGGKITFFSAIKMLRRSFL
jgi:hypothetical protein